ncbi:hypothetical protein ACMFMF_005286 [Clarireedia jacksonii]
MAHSHNLELDVPPTIYQNTPLNLGSKSIRLLSLERDSSGKIKGHLQAFEVASCPSYTALSYAWGYPLPMRHIEIDGSQHPIRENLFNGINSIFDYMRKPHRRRTGDDDTLQIVLKEMEEANLGARAYAAGTAAQSTSDGLNRITLRYIWIDSICIDQDDVAERNHQVNLMKDIFSNAHFVIAWLGYRDMHQFSLRWLYHTARLLLSPKNYLLSASTFCALFRFFNCNYFMRMWIVQELVLAKRSIVMCGIDTIEGIVINKYLKLMLPDFMHSHGAIFLTRRPFKDLSHLIYTYNDPFGRKCMDPRDRIYSLLGISSAWNIPSGLFVDEYGEVNFEGKGTRQKMKNGSTSTWDILPNYESSPFELFLILLQRHNFISIRDIPIILEIPYNLIIPFDNNGAKFQPTLAEEYRIVSAYLPQNVSSRDYIRYVRSLDWTAVDTWPLNYQLLREYSASLPERSSIPFKHLVRYVTPFGDTGLWKWAHVTLE